MKPIISIILPIYKVEAYLKRAIESVLMQTYQNLQILLVDDGSPDLCGEICREYAKKDQRIMVLPKKNGGLSDARNLGLLFSEGEYIAFVDPDDYIAPDYVERLYQACIQTNSKIALCRYEKTERSDLFSDFSGLKKNCDEKENQEPLLYQSRELIRNMYAEVHEEFTSFVVAWNKLYHKSLWQDISFPKGRIHEDEAVMYKIYEKAGQGVFIPQILYAYNQAGESITRQAFTWKRLDCLYALMERANWFEAKSDKEMAGRAYKTMGDTAIVDDRIVRAKDQQVANKLELRIILNRYVRNALTKGAKTCAVPLRTLIGYFIFLISPGLYDVIAGSGKESRKK